MVNLIGYFGLGFGAVGFAFGMFFAYKLREWERCLKGARIAIFFKGRSRMQPSLFEWLRWAQAVERSKTERGREVYKMGGTTVAILQPRHKSHGKSETRQVKDAA